MDFNEKSNKWLSNFKVWIKLIFWLEIIAFAFWGMIDGMDHYTEIGYGLDLLAIPVWILIGVAVALFNKTINMLILQFLSNVNSIRENLENKE